MNTHKTITIAVLIECGFMTNKFDLTWLKSEQYRNYCTRQIFAAIQAYKLFMINQSV